MFVSKSPQNINPFDQNWPKFCEKVAKVGFGLSICKSISIILCHCFLQLIRVFCYT